MCKEECRTITVPPLKTTTWGDVQPPLTSSSWVTISTPVVVAGGVALGVGLGGAGLLLGPVVDGGGVVPLGAVVGGAVPEVTRHCTNQVSHCTSLVVLTETKNESPVLSVAGTEFVYNGSVPDSGVGVATVPLRMCQVKALQKPTVAGGACCNVTENV